MTACAIVGDSIAVDQFAYFPKCVHDAKIGVPSANIIGRVHDADVLVVSAGSNDPDNERLLQNLQAIRAKATGKVIWIVPMNRKAARAVLTVARDHNDKVVTFTLSNDHTHPKYPGQVAKAIREAM